MDNILDILNTSAKNLQQQTTKITKKYHVTIAEWKLLRQIDANIITQDAMASALQLDTSTLSRQLKNLSTKELVSKTAVGKDRRQLEYALTTTGQDALTGINQAYDTLVDAIFHYWPNDEQEMLRIMLKRLDRSLQKATVTSEEDTADEKTHS